jgi:hypothetical protein
VQDALAWIVVVVLVAAVVAAIWASFGTGEAYRQIGRGAFSLDDGTDGAPPTPTAADAGLAAEIRELVIARNQRRARAGKPPLDVEAEVARRLRELL